VMTTDSFYPSQTVDRGRSHGFEPSYPPSPEPITQQESLAGLIAVIEEERLSWTHEADALGLSEKALHDGVASRAYPAIRPDTQRPFCLLDLRDKHRLDQTLRRRVNAAGPSLNVIWRAP
jgi:hypothetical protein